MIDIEEKTYNLTDGSQIFDTRKMTEEYLKRSNALCQVATGHKENPWFWEPFEIKGYI